VICDALPKGFVSQEAKTIQLGRVDETRMKGEAFVVKFTIMAVVRVAHQGWCF
jgi:hypothetical protein